MFGRFQQKKSATAMNDLPSKKTNLLQPPAANESSTHDLVVRLLSEDQLYVDAIIEAGSSAIEAKDLHTILSKRDLIARKVRTISEGSAELAREFWEILRTLEAAALVNTRDPLARCLAEGAFAVAYLLEEEDLIPDSIPAVGLVDDAIIVKRVVSRNGRELVRMDPLDLR
jgi:uncharacterized membrane protein YkvA (DUF1232 family)